MRRYNLRVRPKSYQGQERTPAAMVTPDATRTTPNGLLNWRPQGMFLSMAMTDPSTSIQPTLPAPTPNIRSINDQQQPRQKMPWSKPIRKD